MWFQQPRLGMRRTGRESCGEWVGSFRGSFMTPLPSHRASSQERSHRKVAAKVGRSRFFRIQEVLKSHRVAQERRKALAEDLILALHYMNNDAEAWHSSADSPDHYKLPTNLLDMHLTYSFHPSNTLKQEFLQLRKCCPLPPTAAALLPSNAAKNRSLDVLPADRHRCVLRPLTEKGRRGRSAGNILQRALRDDYINATVVNTGYHEFIATPHPLPGTVSDFWRMVVQTQASTVVMFHAACADLSEFPRYWPTVGEEQAFLGNTTSPIVVTRAPPGPTHPSPAAAATAAAVGAEKANNGRYGEVQTTDYANLVEKAWKEENENRRVLIWRKSTEEYEEDEVQRLHSHTRSSPNCAAERREAGERSKGLQKHQMGQGRKTDIGRVLDANEETHQTRVKQTTATQGEFKEGCGNYQHAKEEGEAAMENRETEGVEVDEDYGTEVEHYHWRGEEEKLAVEETQKNPHYFLSHLHVWVGGNSGSRRRLIPHFHFPGGLEDGGAMLHLLHRVLYNQGVVGGPVVVHCPDGADLSGVFVVLARLVQQEVNRRREEEEKKEEADKRKRKENKEQETSASQGGAVSVYEAVNHVRLYLPCAVRQVTSYRFLYHCMQTYMTSPPDLWGYWVVQRPLPDAKLTALHPYSTKSLLNRVERECPDLLLSSRKAYVEDTERGRHLRLALFQEVIKRIEREMEGESREKSRRREEGVGRKWREEWR